MDILQYNTNAVGFTGTINMQKMLRFNSANYTHEIKKDDM